MSGSVDDGLTDMTGLVSEKINMHNKRGIFPNPKVPMKDDFFTYLKERDNHKCMMGCSRKNDSGKSGENERVDGIICGHAYGIMDVLTLPKSGTKLLLVRNPWGNGKEWKGDWSDESVEFDEHKEELEEYVKSLGDEAFDLGA